MFSFLPVARVPESLELKSAGRNLLHLPVT